MNAKREADGLGNELVLVLFRALCHGGTSQGLPKHKSSHDAARTLAVVAGVVRKPRAGEKLTAQERAKPGSPARARNKIHTSRPRPAELSPFVANIKLDKGTCPTPREYRRCRNLWDIFAAYEPNAVVRRVCHSSSNWADFGLTSLKVVAGPASRSRS